jgi:hypothetical protein
VEVDYILLICTVWLLVAWSQNGATNWLSDSVTSVWFHLIGKYCICFPVTGQIKSQLAKNGYVRLMISQTKEYVFIVCVMWQVGRRNYMDYVQLHCFRTLNYNNLKFFLFVIIEYRTPICTRMYIMYFFFRRYSSLNVLTFSTYDFQFLRSWMQLVQFFIFSFCLCHSLCHRLQPLISPAILCWDFLAKDFSLEMWLALHKTPNLEDQVLYQVCSPR